MLQVRVTDKFTQKSILQALDWYCEFLIKCEELIIICVKSWEQQTSQWF